MRWSGIPARVVVGYQGGTLNKSGNYMEVRYSDAHAWSEVWLNGQWQRVDPTAAISPDRIEFGMDALTELWDGIGFNNTTGRALSDILNPTGSARFFRQVKDSWSNLSYQWNKWVVNYDQDKQESLLKRLGLDHKNSLFTLIIIILIGVSGFMLFYFWQLIPKKIPLEAGDTPEDFRLKACKKFPNSENEINKIIELYQSLRYGNPKNDKTKKMQQFKQLVKQFKLNPH